ncbi:MAG: DUF2804 domain-containing protein, partial [Promethearchaeota archaeon]
WYRLKEWDNYVIMHPDYQLNITVADVGYLGQITFQFINFKTKEKYDDGMRKFFTKGRLNLPVSSLEGDMEFHEERFDLKIQRLSDKRILSFEFPSFSENKGLRGFLTLHQDPKKDSIVKVNRYPNNKKQFYYSDKIVWMPVEGSVFFDNEKYLFSPKDSYCRLDWGRGVWPYKINWYWGAGCGKLEGNHEIWFSYGYSYDDPSFHDKNMVGYDGKGHKLFNIKFLVPDNPTDTWKFVSDDGRFNMILEPFYYHREKMNLIIFSSRSLIAFGYYSGHVILDDGRKVQVKKILGHAESINWRW